MRKDSLWHSWHNRFLSDKFRLMYFCQRLPQSSLHIRRAIHFTEFVIVRVKARHIILKGLNKATAVEEITSSNLNQAHQETFASRATRAARDPNARTTPSTVLSNPQLQYTTLSTGRSTVTFFDEISLRVSPHIAYLYIAHCRRSLSAVHQNVKHRGKSAFPGEALAEIPNARVIPSRLGAHTTPSPCSTAFTLSLLPTSADRSAHCVLRRHPDARHNGNNRRSTSCSGTNPQRDPVATIPPLVLVKKKRGRRSRSLPRPIHRVHRLPRLLEALLSDERSVASGSSTAVAWKSAPRTGRASSGVVVSTGSPRQWRRRRRPMGDAPSRPVDITVHCRWEDNGVVDDPREPRRTPSPSAQRTRCEQA